MHDFQHDIDAVAAIDAVSTILEVVCATTGMGFAAVARVTETRWVACKVRDSIGFGLQPGGELDVGTTICDEIRQSGTAVIIDHVSQDGAFCSHPTPAKYGFQSYISMPIVRRDGSFFGTLCAIDPQPARLDNPQTIGMFKLFAELIATHLDAATDVAATRRLLVTERKISELRDQFVAVLGHDLKNPIAAIGAGTRLLLKGDLDAKSIGIVNLIQGSLHRMSGLVENVLDFARARLGDGIKLERRDEMLEPILRQVFDELRAVNPECTMRMTCDVLGPVNIDGLRVAQMTSNLLANALNHGAKNAPVEVRAAVEEGILNLSVANSGEPIPQAQMETLFLPFSRGRNNPGTDGLGLGLYIASRIAAAHGGSLSVDSSPAQTRFTFRMKLV